MQQSYIYGAAHKHKITGASPVSVMAADGGCITATSFCSLVLWGSHDNLSLTWCTIQMLCSTVLDLVLFAILTCLELVFNTFSVLDWKWILSNIVTGVQWQYSLCHVTSHLCLYNLVLILCIHYRPGKGVCWACMSLQLLCIYQVGQVCLSLAQEWTVFGIKYLIPGTDCVDFDLKCFVFVVKFRVMWSEMFI